MALGVLLISYSCSSTKRTESKIYQEINALPEISRGFTGFALYDSSSKRMLISHNAEQYFTPASNIKLFTLFTGLKILGDSVPALKYTIHGDSLIFQGTGDPSFLNPKLPGSEVYSFLKNAEYKLYFAPADFKEKPLGPGWAWDDYDSYYSAERTDFPLYGNLLKIRYDNESGKAIVKPNIFQDSIAQTNISVPKNKYAQREIASNKMKYQPFPRDRDFEQQIPINFSPGLISKLLSDTLKKPVSVYQLKKDTLDFNKTIYSIAADSIYKRMMQESDNFLAEQVLLLAAGKLSDTLSTQIAVDYMLDKHLKDLPDEPKWVDGSGLSRYNLATPRTMVHLLEKIQAELPREKIHDIFPAGGQSGTLPNDYLAQTPYIYAKTGTLRNNYSLSGFLVTRSNRILIFSFMNSNYTISISELKQKMNLILKQIRDHY